MHIEFTSIRYKNILSVGNQFIEVTLNDAKTTLLGGSNGSGKSTMIEALVFALYGKPFRKITKPQLVNSVNSKELLVELDFKIGQHVVQIRRGIKPNVFEIFKDGVLLNKDAAAKDYQQHLEQNILKMSMKSFTQIVILGSATYVPFMDLPAAQRREIIEDLLDIQVFSTMNVLLKGRISENKTAITETTHNLQRLGDQIDFMKQRNDEINDMKQGKVKELAAKIAEVTADIERKKVTVKPLTESIEQYAATITDKSKMEAALSKIQTFEYELRAKAKAIVKEAEFYQTNEQCPTCKQPLDETHRNEHIEQHKVRIEEIKQALQQLKEKREKCDLRISEIAKVEENIQEVRNKINEVRMSIKVSNDFITDLKSDLSKAEQQAEKVDDSQLLALTEQHNQLQDDVNQLHKKREVLGVVGAMLKDGGIKTSIVRAYIPVMNKIINQYLSEFELFVDFNLDENFNETIKSRYRDAFSFASFSEGEKMRITLSIMFTWRAVAKLRNSVSTNLLIMDETLDGPSDAEGIESLIDILHRLNANDNIFVISHRGPQLAEKFERHIQFEKVRNFTRMVA